MPDISQLRRTEPFSSSQAAFEVMLGKALGATPADAATVVYDENFEPHLFALSEAMLRAHIPSALIKVPISWQRAIVADTFTFGKTGKEHRKINVPDPLIAALGESSIVISVLSGHTDTLPFRVALLDAHRRKGARFAHIPGLSQQILDVVRQTDFDQTLSNCELLAWHLGNATNAELMTCDYADNCYSLQFGLGGWNNEPLMSPGIISPDSWGNFPPGETFCCPERDTARGDIFINGSLPDNILHPDQGIRLTFAAGRMVRWQAVNAPGAAQFLSAQEALALERGDDNWNILCEFGIGLNVAIGSLRGLPLFDEKAANTVHIALGDNTQFGGPNKAAVHLDLVTRPVAVLLDRDTLFENGSWDEAKLHSVRDAFSVSATTLGDNERVRVNAAKVAEDDGRLVRRLSRGKRLGSVRLTTGDAAGALAALAHVANAYQTPPKVSDLYTDIPAVRGFDTKKLLTLLDHYKCLTIIG